MSRLLSSAFARPRSRAPAHALIVAALRFAALPGMAGAQVTVDLSTMRSRPDADGAPAERDVRRLTLHADSLARAFGDNALLGAAQRRQIGAELDATVEALDRAMRALRDGMARTAGPGARWLSTPMATAQRRAAMFRALHQGRSRAFALAPRGWLGIVVTGAAREPWVEHGELFIRYVTHPEIVSVEPSSPAELAGLASGDTLLAYDGRDVRDTDISMTRLLTPHARVMVRIVRDRRTRDVPVTIAEAPSRILLRRDDMNGAMSITRERGPMDPAPAYEVPSGESAASSPAPTGIGGAQMGSITRGWARLTGVRAGVIVMRVPPGSSAAASGLRDADVIVKAGGQAVRTLPELRDLLGRARDAGTRELALEVVRERRERAVRLQW